MDILNNNKDYVCFYSKMFTHPGTGRDDGERGYKRTLCYTGKVSNIFFWILIPMIYVNTCR